MCINYKCAWMGGGGGGAGVTFHFLALLAGVSPTTHTDEYTGHLVLWALEIMFSPVTLEVSQQGLKFKTLEH